MRTTELREWSRQWERETDGTLALMSALPPEHYDFRPDATERSLGELAWHLAEVDAYVSLGIERGEFILHFSDGAGPIRSARGNSCHPSPPCRTAS